MGRMILFLLVLLVVASTASAFEVQAGTDGWIREADPSHSLYEVDGISVWSSSGNDGARRYGLIEFDLSSLAGETVTEVHLDLFSALHGYSDYSKPIKQSIYEIDSSGTALGNLDWNTYIAEKDAGKAAFETLGAYDLPAASDVSPLYDNVYVLSTGSAADISLVQNAIDGDGILSLVLIAAEDGTDYAQSWGDGEAGWAGAPDGNPVLYVNQIPEPATLTLIGLGGVALLRRKRT